MQKSSVHILDESLDVSDSSLTEFVNGYHTTAPPDKDAPVNSPGVTTVVFSGIQL